jgi:hypothetical protein
MVVGPKNSFNVSKALKADEAAADMAYWAALRGCWQRNRGAPQEDLAFALSDVVAEAHLGGYAMAVGRIMRRSLLSLISIKEMPQLKVCHNARMAPGLSGPIGVISSSIGGSLLVGE